MNPNILKICKVYYWCYN